MDKRGLLIEQRVSDAVTQRADSFRTSRRDGWGRLFPFIGRRGRTYIIHPPTLGKMQVLAKHWLALEIDEEAIMKAPITETMRLCEGKPMEVARLIAVATLDRKSDLLSDRAIERRARRVLWECGTDDFRYALGLILQQTDCTNFMTAMLLTRSLRQNEPRAGREGSVA